MIISDVAELFEVETEFPLQPRRVCLFLKRGDIAPNSLTNLLTAVVEEGIKNAALSLGGSWLETRRREVWRDSATELEKVSAPLQTRPDTLTCFRSSNKYVNMRQSKDE